MLLLISDVYFYFSYCFTLIIIVTFIRIIIAILILITIIIIGIVNAVTTAFYLFSNYLCIEFIQILLF